MSVGRAALPRGAQLSLVMLDCDGVLFDSWEANVAFYDAILHSVGLPPLDDVGRELCHRLSSAQLFEQLFGADPVVLQRVRETARLIDYTPYYAFMRPARMLHATLERLSAHCPLALATNRGTTVRGVIERFELARFFKIHVGILDVERPKPAPDLLVACLQRAAVSPQAAVYVGDTELDRTAAAAAGVPYVGVGPASGARWCIDELRDLPALLLPSAPTPATPR